MRAMENYINGVPYQKGDIKRVKDMLTKCEIDCKRTQQKTDNFTSEPIHEFRIDDFFFELRNTTIMSLDSTQTNEVETVFFYRK